MKKHTKCRMNEICRKPHRDGECERSCYYNTQKVMTNYDRIVSKSPGELAEWLAEVLFHCSNTICDQRCPMYECCCDQPSDNIEDWLKQEAKT